MPFNFPELSVPWNRAAQFEHSSNDWYENRYQGAAKSFGTSSPRCLSPGFPLSKERSAGEDEDKDWSLLSSLSSLSWTRSMGEKRVETLAGSGMDLPLTSPAIPAFVHPRRARQLHILQFRFLQFVPLTHWEMQHSVSLPLTHPPCRSSFPLPSSWPFLFLSAPSSFFPPLFFSRTSSLLLGFPPPVFFRPSDYGYLARPSSCLWSTSVSCVSLPVLR